MKDSLYAPITSLHGIGKTRAEAFARLGLHTVRDLLFHFPRSYEDRGTVRLLSETREGEKQAVRLVVAGEPHIARIRRGMNLLKFRAYDDSGSCEITYFNQDYLKTAFSIGREFRFYGKVERVGGRFTMSSPAHEECLEHRSLAPFFSLYPATEGLSQNLIQKSIGEALCLARQDLADYLPAEYLPSPDTMALTEALFALHKPTSIDSLCAAKDRLVYDELFLFALAMRSSAKKQKGNGAKKCLKKDISKFTNLLPYTFTNGQNRAIRDILHDMAEGTPMSRIVVGDVGCGKTVCAAAAMLSAAENGYQSVLMAPTEILARQHYADLAPLFDKLGLKTVLLVGALTEKKKKEARAALCGAKGERADIVIGTQALLTETVSFSDLALIVIDEQHRFGVDQRRVLAEKGEHTHVLVMSATPIPRSLALTLYGDLDVSRITDMPPGRQTVDTFLVGESYRERLNGFVHKQVKEGGQVYIVCPAVEEAETAAGEVAFEDIFDERADKPPLKSAVTYAETLKESLPDLNIAFVHGKMKSADKDAVMTAFAHGDIDVLVSTTVIEVGVNVPNACLMIVENAERFGLSQLHQLRGRVGRGKRKSYCVLVSDSKGETARERLTTLCKTHNGYEIAEKDLALRGPGDFLRASGGVALRQSGAFTFRLADLCRDTAVMSMAFAKAEAVLKEDPHLDGFPALRAEMFSRFFPDASAIT